MTKKQFMWSEDRECWMGTPPKGHSVTTYPIVHLLKLVSPANPTDILDERISVWELIDAKFLLGEYDENLYR